MHNGMTVTSKLKNWALSYVSNSSEPVRMQSYRALIPAKGHINIKSFFSVCPSCW